MAKQFNTSELRIEIKNKVLLLPQKKNSQNQFYMNTQIDNREYDWFLTRSQAEQLYRHLGGMLAKEEKE